MAKIADDGFGSDTIVGIVNQAGDGRKPFRIAAFAMGILALAVIPIALLRPIINPRTLTELAGDFVSLPAGAHVLAVKDDDKFADGAGQREVWFSLDEPKGPGSRQTEIWTATGMPSLRSHVYAVSTSPPRPHMMASPGVPPVAVTPVMATKTAKSGGGSGFGAAPMGKGTASKTVAKATAIVPTPLSPYVPVLKGHTITMRGNMDEVTALEFDPKTGRYHYWHKGAHYY